LADLRHADVTSVYGAYLSGANELGRDSRWRFAWRSRRAQAEVRPIDRQRETPRDGGPGLMMRLTDAQGANRSAADLMLIVQAVKNASGVPVDGTAGFRFVDRSQAYRLEPPGSTLAPGTYLVSFTVAGDPVEHALKVTVR
jgi:hypothetical protein